MIIKAIYLKTSTCKGVLVVVLVPKLSFIMASSEDLTLFSKEALIARIQKLEANVKQLKNILAKKSNDGRKNKAKPTRKQKKKFDFSRFKKRHIALKLAYLGWDYHGFASSECEQKTIEAVLFEALTKIKLINIRETANYHRCGRTDKGVSAFSQVISLDVRTNLTSGLGVIDAELPQKEDSNKPELRFAHLLNKVLPPDVRVLAWAPVDSAFSARFDCLQRTYKYYFPRGCLDIEAMKSACEHLVGTHDFRNLCKMDILNGITNFTRTIYSADIKPLHDMPSNGYQLFELTIVGQSFLWHQIRCIVAVLFLIGQKNESPTIVIDLLDISKNACKPQYSMAAALPLVLYECEFENVQWQYDIEAFKLSIEQLQASWTMQTIKSASIKELLDHLEKTLYANNKDDQILNQATYLQMGTHSKMYKPLLERPKCDSLESRLAHHAKRQKLEESTKEET